MDFRLCKIYSTKRKLNIHYNFNYLLCKIYCITSKKKIDIKKILLENEINKVKISVKKTPGNNKVKSSVTAVELKITSTT